MLKVALKPLTFKFEIDLFTLFLLQTDDQILLLQNSWAELLIFNCCMKSIESRTEIFLPLGKTVDLEKAGSISEGCEDIIQRMLDLTDQLRRIGVDQYEYVAMKVLVLITPGKVVHSC